jgi:hypothetical protein
MQVVLVVVCDQRGSSTCWLAVCVNPSYQLPASPHCTGIVHPMLVLSWVHHHNTAVLTPLLLLLLLQISFGANIAKFPAGGFLHVVNINDASGKNNPTPGDWAPFGVTASGKGQVAVLGDSNCLDSSHMVRAGRERDVCRWLLHVVIMWM